MLLAGAHAALQAPLGTTSSLSARGGPSGQAQMCVRQSSQLYFSDLAFEFPGLLPGLGAADMASRLAAAS
eukprot:7826969-Prorocentrum_lima.AAC.1